MNHNICSYLIYLEFFFLKFEKYCNHFIQFFDKKLIIRLYSCIYIVNLLLCLK